MEAGRWASELHELAKLRAVVDAFPDLYVCFDSEGRILEHHSAPGRTVHIPREQLLGRAIGEIIPGPLGVQVREAVRAAATTGRSVVMTYELPLAAGSEWFEGRIVPLPPDRAMAVVRVVTDRVRAEAEVLRSREQYRALVETIDGIVWEADASFRFTYVSAQAERLLGYPVSRWIDDATFWADHLHPDDRGWAVDYCMTAVAGLRPHTFEYRMIAADGRVVWLRDIVSVFAEEGRARLLRGVMVDVTDRKIAEAERQRLLVEAQDAVRAREEFLSIASHELRTPLTSLQLSLQSVLRAAKGVTQRPPEFVRGALESAERQVQRLARLVDQLFDVSRITMGRLELCVETVDLGEVVHDVIGALRAELVEAGVTIEVEEDDRVVGRWDRARLEQVVTNLTGNAIKYGEGRPISIELRASSGRATLVVRHRGIGIQPDRLPMIFDRFERAVPARSYGGLGLGLFIVRRIVEAHGGRVTASSEAGTGSSFLVELPDAER